MKTKRTKRSAEITVETEEVVLVKGNARAVRMHCPGCHREVRMITPEQAARIAGVSTRTIYRWVEAGGAHFIEDGGQLLICVPGLSARRAERMQRRTSS